MVAGASEGLGAAYAWALAARGPQPCAGRPAAAALDALARICAPRTVWRSAARTAIWATGASWKVCRTRAPPLDVGLLVYNAAHAPVGEFASLPIDDLLRVAAVNIRAPVALVRGLLPGMTERGRGGVILMTSLAGNQGSPYIATYAASKAFNRVLAEGLWYELKDKGVDVVACCAGAVRTPGYGAAAGKDAPGTLDPEEVVEQALRALGRGPVVIPGFVNRVAKHLHDPPAASAEGDIHHGRQHRDLVPAVARAGGSGAANRSPCPRRRRSTDHQGRSMTDFAAGFFAPWIIYAVILALHLVLPARKVDGYVNDPATGRPLRYRLNGPLVLVAMVLLWVILSAHRRLRLGLAVDPPLVGTDRLRPSSVCSSASRWSCPLRAPAARSLPTSTSAATRTRSCSATGWTPRCSCTWSAPRCSR